MTILPAPEASALPDFTVQSSSPRASAAPRIVFVQSKYDLGAPVIPAWEESSRTLCLLISPDHCTAEMVELLNDAAHDVPTALPGVTMDSVDRLPVDIPVIGWSPETHRMLVDERHLSVQAAAAISAELSNLRIFPPGLGDVSTHSDSAAAIVPTEGMPAELAFPDGTTLSSTEQWWPAEGPGVPELRQFIVNCDATFPMDLSFAQFAALPGAMRRFANALDQQLANAGRIGGKP